MTTIDTHLERLDTQIEYLRDLREKAGDRDDIRAEKALTGHINELTNQYVILKDKKMQILENSSETEALITRFQEIEKRIENWEEDLDELKTGIEKASFLVSAVYEIVGIIK